MDEDGRGGGGYSTLGEGSNAWDVIALEEHFYFWATQEEDEPRPYEDIVADEGYDVHLEFGQGVVHTNGTNFLWQIPGLLVWIQSPPTSEFDTRVLEQLLSASLRTPYPPELLPQP